MNLNDVEYYYIRNTQGDIIGIIDGSGNEVVEYTYDSWGKLISIEGTKKDSVGVKILIDIEDIDMIQRLDCIICSQDIIILSGVGLLIRMD